MIVILSSILTCTPIWGSTPLNNNNHDQVHSYPIWRNHTTNKTRKQIWRGLAKGVGYTRTNLPPIFG